MGGLFCIKFVVCVTISPLQFSRKQLFVQIQKKKIIIKGNTLFYGLETPISFKIGFLERT